MEKVQKAIEVIKRNQLSKIIEGVVQSLNKLFSKNPNRNYRYIRNQIENIEKGKEWIKNRYTNPITIEKAKECWGELIKDPETHLNKKINNIEYSLQLFNYFSLKKLNGKNNKITSRGRYYLITETSHVGINTVRIFSLLVSSSQSTAVHELAHFIDNDGREFLSENLNLADLFSENNMVYKEPKNRNNFLIKGLQKDRRNFLMILGKISREKYSYLTKNHEIYARIMEMRCLCNKKPGDIFTPSDINICKKRGNYWLKKMLRLIKPNGGEEKFIKLINHVSPQLKGQ